MTLFDEKTDEKKATPLSRSGRKKKNRDKQEIDSDSYHLMEVAS